MISDRTKLKVIVTLFGIVSFFTSIYLWYLMLKQINASDYIWFVWVFWMFFSAILVIFRDVIFETEKRIKSLEERISRIEGI